MVRYPSQRIHGLKIQPSQSRQAFDEVHEHNVQWLLDKWHLLHDVVAGSSDYWFYMRRPGRQEKRLERSKEEGGMDGWMDDDGRKTHLHSGLVLAWPPKTSARRSTTRGNSSAKAGRISTCTSGDRRSTGNDVSPFLALCESVKNNGGGRQNEKRKGWGLVLTFTQGEQSPLPPIHIELTFEVI